MNPNAIYKQAIERFNKKDVAGSLRLFEMLPPVPFIRYNTALCYRELGGLENLDQSRKILAKLVKSKVKDGTLYNQIKDAYVSVMTSVVKEYAKVFRIDEAMHENLKSMKIIPRHYVLLYNQGHLYKCLGEHEKALEFLNKSLIYKPDYFDAFIEKVNVYNDAKDYKSAEKVVLAAIEVIPGDARLCNELGVILCRLGRIKDGFDAYQKGLEMPSCDAVVKGKIYTNVGNAYSFLGDIPASISNSKLGFEADPTNLTAMQNYLMNHLYLPNVPFSSTLKNHFEVGTLYAKQAVIKDYKVVPYIKPLNEKIHVGFVSPDFFGEHPVTYFLKALLTCWDRNNFAIYCYSNQKLDTVPQYSPDIEWRDIKYLDTKNVCNKIVNEDRIDVLIDLASHTAGNRLDIFSNRCARVQLSYIGYPCITGIPEIDYYIIDKTFDMTLKCIAMPHCFTHYWPKDIPDASTLVSPYAKNGYYSFGTLNKLAKVNQAMVDTWDCLLDYFPNSRLLIRRNYVFKFRNQDRVVSLEHEESYKGHMKRYNQIDIALDTAPYSGTTTTCESLLMGTPVITLADRKTKTIHQNVSASLLINSGLGNLVVENLDDYKRVITALMEEIDKTPDFKQQIQHKFLSGSVCNTEEYMHDFQTLITDLHHSKV